MLKHARRATLALTTSALLVGGSLSGCGFESEPTGAEPAAAQQDGPGEQAAAAAAWLSRQPKNGIVSTSYENPPGSGKWTSSPDYGLSLDMLFALQGIEDSADVRKQILSGLEPDLASYVGTGKDAYAGAAGKVVSALQAEGVDPAEYGDGGLVQKTESLVVTKGPETGRAKDAWDPANDFGGDYSNSIGQSWVVRALTAVDSDLADETLAFLLDQQCADGFFRLSMGTQAFTCDEGTRDESVPSVDATAFAVEALVEVRDSGTAPDGADVDGALTDAAEWLLAAQEQDGSFVDADTGQPNANSTGVAAEALIAMGEDEAARRAAQWLSELQVTEGDTGPGLGAEAGAVAFDERALQVADRRGITRADRYQWQRATAQSVAALDALD